MLTVRFFALARRTPQPVIVRAMESVEDEDGLAERNLEKYPNFQKWVLQILLCWGHCACARVFVCMCACTYVYTLHAHVCVCPRACMHVHACTAWWPANLLSFVAMFRIKLALVNIFVPAFRVASSFGLLRFFFLSVFFFSVIDDVSPLCFPPLQWTPRRQTTLCSPRHIWVRGCFSVEGTGWCWEGTAGFAGKTDPRCPSTTAGWNGAGHSGSPSWRDALG